MQNFVIALCFLMMPLDQDLAELMWLCCQYDWMGENMQDRERRAGLYNFLLLHCRCVFFLLILPFSLICFNANLIMTWFCEGTIGSCFRFSFNLLNLYSMHSRLKGGDRDRRGWNNLVGICCCSFPRDDNHEVQEPLRNWVGILSQASRKDETWQPGY